MAYDFLALLDTRLELGNVPLRLIVELFLDVTLSDYAKALLRVEFALPHMPLSAHHASGSHSRGRCPSQLSQPGTSRSKSTKTPFTTHNIGIKQHQPARMMRCSSAGYFRDGIRWLLMMFASSSLS